MPPTCDAIVVGGGILGAATAYYLARTGRRVVLLERGAPNREGSGTTAGNLHMQAIHPRRPGQAVPADNRRFLPLQIAASALWTHLEEELGCSIELRRHGGLMIAETPEQVEELHHKSAMERELGLDTEVLDGATARGLVPMLSEHVLAADWCAEDGYANPLLVTPAYLRAARRHGAEVRAFAPVRTIRPTAARTYVVGTDHDQWETPVVVNVAGPWIAEVAALAGIALQMAPVAIQMHATVRIPATMKHLVQHVSEGLSVKQVSAGNVLVGGGWPAAEIDLHGRSRVRAASVSGNLRQASRVLPFIAGLRLLRTWAGPLAATPDEMPVIGEVPGASGFFVAGGTYAFTLAPLWGLTLAALLDGEEAVVPIDDLSPGRLLLSAPAPVAARAPI